MNIQPVIARPMLLLRAEALCVLVATCAAYHGWFAHHWVMFACVFLVPDLSLLMYVGRPSAAASVVYNLVHSYVSPMLLGGLAIALGNLLLEGVSLIWISHIAFDRALGYGLKYPDSFQFTHIQSAGAPVAASPSPSA